MAHDSKSGGAGPTDRGPGPSGNPRDGTEGGGNDLKRFRRRRSRKKLPAEFAEFRLADGRTLREVMGDRFFGSARGGAGGGRFMSKAVRDRLRQGAGNAPASPEDGAALSARLAKRRAMIAERRARGEARRAEQQALAEAQAAKRQARIAEFWAGRRGGDFSFGGG